MSSTRTLMTAAELELMPDVDSEQDLRHELDEGELIEMPPAGEGHGFVICNIIRLVATCVHANKLGSVYSPDTGFKLSDDTVRAPAVAFVRREREVRSRGYFPGAPDLAVGVLSLSDKPVQLVRKLKQYFTAGTHTVWVVDPEDQEVNIFGASGANRILRGDDPIEAPELLPGFSVPVSQFFAD